MDMTNVNQQTGLQMSIAVCLYQRPFELGIHLLILKWHAGIPFEKRDRHSFDQESRGRYQSLARAGRRESYTAETLQRALFCENTSKAETYLQCTETIAGKPL